jgi:hypothetical protein
MDNFYRWLAWHLPRRLVMWCAYRVAANATTGQYSNTIVAELSMMEMFKRWTNRYRKRRKPGRF